MAEITAVIAPVAPIEHDVSFPTSVMLDGTGSIAGDPANHEDPAPTITGWAWSIIWQKTGSTANLINANTSTPTLQGITAGDSVYIYLQVTNSEGASTPADPIPTQRAEAPYDFVKPAITAFVAVVVKLANTDLVYPPVGSRGWFPTSYYPLIAEVEDLADRVDMVEAGTIPDPLVLDEMHANVKMRATSYEPLGGTTLDVTAEAVDMQEVGEPVQVRHDLTGGSTAFGADVDDTIKAQIDHATGDIQTEGDITAGDISGYRFYDNDYTYLLPSSVDSHENTAATETVFSLDATPVALPLPVVVDPGLFIEWEAVFAFSGTSSIGDSITLKAYMEEATTGPKLADTGVLSGSFSLQTLITLRGSLCVVAPGPNGTYGWGKASSSWVVHEGALGIKAQTPVGGVSFVPEIYFTAEWGSNSGGDTVHLVYACAKVKRRYSP